MNQANETMAPGLAGEILDVIIVGAGISGISAAWHLQQLCPGKSYALLEGRARMGGTWDLFRYPGIRSDSDMHTMGFSFKPWTAPQAISDGKLIRNYIKEAADENGITPNIHFNQQVQSLSWDSKEAVWTVTTESSGQPTVFKTRFVQMCSGYYSYDKPYLPDFPGYDLFKGPKIHPQKWPEDLDYANKRVVIIGSGATAVTILPVMAETAKHVTMLQRSPTYMVSQPSIDPLSQFLKRFLPNMAAYRITRLKNILLQRFFYSQARKYPEKAKETILGMLKEDIGTEMVEKHFTPSYKPWDQRLCLVPDNDFFNALKAERASVVTDHIETFTETGIKLKSGEHLDADIIITATGLQMQIMNELDISLDGVKTAVPEHLVYKGVMLSDIPNMAFTMGYSNASWTLKADLTSSWLCRLLNFMSKKGYASCVPELDSSEVDTEVIMNLDSGYVQRSIGKVPQQGTKAPWQQLHNYLKDRVELSMKSLDDGVLKFGKKGESLASVGANTGDKVKKSKSGDLKKAA